jgi:hypothetical protein
MPVASFIDAPGSPQSLGLTQRRRELLHCLPDELAPVALGHAEIRRAVESGFAVQSLSAQQCAQETLVIDRWGSRNLPPVGLPSIDTECESPVQLYLAGLNFWVALPAAGGGGTCGPLFSLHYFLRPAPAPA